VNLAFLHVDLPPEGEGGVAYQVDLLAQEMAKRHEVTVFTTTTGRPARPFRTVQCESPKMGATSRLFGVGLAFGRLDLEPFDVVHAHGDSWAVRHPSVIRTFYGTAAAEARSAVSLRRRSAQTVKYGLELVACARSQMRTTIGTHAKRFLPRIDRVIPCGVDPEIFHPGGDRFEQPTVLLVAGRLGGRKRGWLALDAFTSVRRQIPDARMIVISRDIVDVPGVECRAAISSEEIGGLFRQSWVLCSASSYEGFGLPYAEALVSGLPVVTTRNPGAEEVLSGGEGTVVQDQDLGEALIAALTHGPSSSLVRARASGDRFRIDRIADQFDELYEQVRSK
jgi:phosphatidylinositol alpha-mannosyltransferase